MLTYSLSSREKALVLILVLVLVAVAWFVFVFQRTGNEITSLESQIANAESEIAVDQARVTQMASMKETIAEREEAGSVPVAVPAYDNMTPLMGELNRVLSGAATYSVSFDGVDVDSGGNYVNRGVQIDFGCDSYGRARELVSALANGSFPCAVDSVTINDSSAGSSAPASGSSVSASLHLTYLEKRTGNSD